MTSTRLFSWSFLAGKFASQRGCSGSGHTAISLPFVSASDRALLHRSTYVPAGAATGRYLSIRPQPG